VGHSALLQLIGYDSEVAVKGPAHELRQLPANANAWQAQGVLAIWRQGYPRLRIRLRLDDGVERHAPDQGRNLVEPGQNEASGIPWMHCQRCQVAGECRTRWLPLLQPTLDPDQGIGRYGVVAGENGAKPDAGIGDTFPL